MGPMVGSMVNSKRADAKGERSSAPVPVVSPANPQSPPTPSGSFGSFSYGVTAPLLRVSVSTKFCLCPPRLESLFPHSFGRPIIKSCWPSSPDLLGIPSPFVGSLCWEAWVVVQKLHNSARTTLVLLFSSLGDLPSTCGIWFYHDCTPPTVLLGLLLCL